MEKKERISWIDYLKVFACILVVLGHLIQSLQKSNFDNFENITSFINWFIYLFHMPLFFVASGYLYELKKKDFSLKQYKGFIFKKIINLGVPYLTFYLLYVLINIMFASSVNSPKGINEIIGIVNNPMPPYWFLYALLSIFIFIPLLEKLLKNKKNLIFIVLVCLKVLSVFIDTNIYLIDSFFENAVYFYLGSVLKVWFEKKRNINTNNSILYSILAIFIYIIVSIVFYLNSDKIGYNLSEITKIAFAIVAVLICINIFRKIKTNFIFENLKNYTFQIYLLHTIFAAGFRIVLLKVGISNYAIHFIIGLIASIIIPIIIAKICEKTKYLNFFFYPLKTLKKIKNKNNKGEVKNVK